MFNDISCDKKDNDEECVANDKVVSLLARKFGIGQWSLIGPGSEKKCTWRKNTVLKEFGITSRQRCCWNSQKADIQFSVQQLHCPGVSSKPKDTENCLYILMRIIKQLRLFFAYLLLPISSVFTEQSKTCVKNMNTFTIGQGNLMCWWDNELSSVKSRQKFLWRMASHHTRIFYCNDMKNKSKCFHRKTKWVNFVWMQDSYMLLRLDSISWLRTLENNSLRRLVVNTLFQEMMDHHNQKDGSRETQKLDLYWKLRPVVCMVEIRIWSVSQDNSHPWVRISFGSNNPKTNLWSIRATW